MLSIFGRVIIARNTYTTEHPEFKKKMLFKLWFEIKKEGYGRYFQVKSLHLFEFQISFFFNPWILKIGNLFDELGSRIKNIFFLILQEPKQELGQGDQA